MLSDLKKLAKQVTNIYSPSGHKIGAVPGEVKLSKEDFAPLEMQVINYNLKECSARSIDDVSEVAELKDKKLISWLIVNGFGGKKFFNKLKDDLGLHGLVVEEIVNLHHPPKIDILNDSIFIVLRLVLPDNSGIDSSISIIISENNLYLFSPAGKFKLADKLISRIEKGRGVVRERGIDYLLFAIIDLVIDSYFPQIDSIASSIKEIDSSLFENKNTKLLHEIKTIRQVLTIYFDNLDPIKDIISKLLHDDNEFVHPRNVKYFNHALNHANYLCERINRLKESTSDIMNLNISMNGQKMNEIMKVLTMMSSIFIPLSFICGLYGMNFDTSKSPYNMPELNFYYGYPVVVGIMFTLVIGMMIYFYKKKWF